MSTNNDRQHSNQPRRWLGVVAGTLLGISGVAAIGAVQSPAPAKPAAPTTAAAAGGVVVTTQSGIRW